LSAPITAVNTKYSYKKVVTNREYYIPNSLRHSFNYLNLNLFNFFFLKSNLNIPKDLLMIDSVKRVSNNNYTLKFNNYFMTNGTSLKTLLTINASWDSLWLPHAPQNNPINWFNMYPIFNPEAVTLKKWAQTNFSPHTFLLEYINSHKLIFLIYTYRVSKNIYKNTRGKAGKYMFLCKFVPVYKRAMVTLTWLIKELRLTPQRKLSLRLVNLVLSLSHSPHKSWPARIKNFSHTYVYRNCTKTLATNYLAVKV